jgi:hypothetical protein
LWRYSAGSPGTGAGSADTDGADAQVTGTSSDLYRWLWNRPSGAVVNGDRAALGWWADNVRVGWG